MQIFLNTGNYFVPKNKYLKLKSQIDEQFAYYTVDVVYFNMLWLKNNNKLMCVKDYEYDHIMRDDSYYMTHGGLCEEKRQLVYSLFYDNI